MMRRGYYTYLEQHSQAASSVMRGTFDVAGWLNTKAAEIEDEREMERKALIECPKWRRFYDMLASNEGPHREIPGLSGFTR